MRLAPLAAALVLGGCHVERDDSRDQTTFFDNGVVRVSDASASWKIGIGKGSEQPREPQLVLQATSARGKVADLASVLDPVAEQRLAARVEAAGRESGRQLFVVTVPIGKGESLELFGWAVRTPPGMHSLLVDPRSRTVRIEGPLSAEAKGEIARAMRPALVAERWEDALGIGIERLGA